MLNLGNQVASVGAFGVTLMNANRKDIEAKLGRVPKGLERIWIGDDPWHVRQLFRAAFARQ